eukprot:TRINITY_DN7723_c0_g1_i2.p1 TRINITY_DN7723_c0_g1~~TRINITY_DN7723_c0_g1_i2.p1  ORF type:complete len:116 (-),score=31.24 TRINITY_DN7723_c0_g1_i2:220-567(-)
MEQDAARARPLLRCMCCCLLLWGLGAEHCQRSRRRQQQQRSAICRSRRHDVCFELLQLLQRVPQSGGAGLVLGTFRAHKARIWRDTFQNAAMHLPQLPVRGSNQQQQQQQHKHSH